MEQSAGMARWIAGEGQDASLSRWPARLITSAYRPRTRPDRKDVNYFLRLLDKYTEAGRRAPDDLREGGDSREEKRTWHWCI